MAPYFKTGTFNTKKYGLSWHEGEKDFAPIEDGDDLFTSMEKGRMLGIEVVDVPMYMHVNGQTIAADKKGLVLTGVPWTETGIQDLSRQVAWYKGLSNREYAATLNPLVGDWPVAGVLHAGPVGEVMAIQLELDPFDVGGHSGENHLSYLLVGDDRKTGKKYFHITTVRVVCQNTFNMAVAGVKSMPSGKDAGQMLAFRVALEQAAKENRRKHINDLNKMFTTKRKPEDIDTIANILFPMPKRPLFLDMVDRAEAVEFDFSADDAVAAFASEKRRKVERDYQAGLDRQEAYIKGFNQRVAQFDDEHSYAAGTIYGLWQAATDAMKPSSDLFERTENDTAMYKLFFGGDRAKQLEAAYSHLTK